MRRIRELVRSIERTVDDADPVTVRGPAAPGRRTVRWSEVAGRLRDAARLADELADDRLDERERAPRAVPEATPRPARGADGDSPALDAADAIGDVQGYPPGGMIGDAAMWATTAAVSGVVGNVSYELLKAALVRILGRNLPDAPGPRAQTLVRLAVQTRCAELGLPIPDRAALRVDRLRDGEFFVEGPHRLAAKVVLPRDGDGVEVTVYPNGRDTTPSVAEAVPHRPEPRREPCDPWATRTAIPSVPDDPAPPTPRRPWAWRLLRGWSRSPARRRGGHRDDDDREPGR